MRRPTWELDAPIAYFPPQRATLEVSYQLANRIVSSDPITLETEPRSPCTAASRIVAFPVTHTALCILRPNETTSNVATFTIGEGVAAFSTVRFNLLSQQRTLLKGSLQALVKEPHGCFEQTSSTLYPMILSLLYSSSTTSKAASFLSAGVARLLGYEVEGGGYSWFGSKPANEPLTAYGLLEFQALLQLQEERGLLETTQVNLLREAVARTTKWLLVKVGRECWAKQAVDTVKDWFKDLSREALDSFGYATENTTVAYLVYSLSAVVKESEDVAVFSP